MDGQECPSYRMAFPRIHPQELAADFQPRYAASMEKQRLLETLDALRAEVAQASQVDPGMLADLRRLTDEIRQNIDSETAAAADSDEPVEAHGLKDLLLRFEADHPQFSVAVGKVADALAAMGF